MSKDKIKQTTYFETPGFLVDKNRWKFTLENVKVRSRKPCENKECIKYGLMFDRGLPTNYPRIDPGETIYKLTLYLMVSGDMWSEWGFTFNGTGYFCSDECLQKGYKQLQETIRKFTLSTQDSVFNNLRKKLDELK